MLLCVVRATSGRPLVAEPTALRKKDLGFWLGTAVWIAPPLLALIVWAR
jgi:hypothetical protein